MATQVTLNSGSVDSAGSLALKTNGTTTAVTINASQGVEFNAGTAALPSITTTGDTNTGIFFPAADTIAFAEGGAESMRIDSSGNMGLGVTPSAWGSAFKVLQLANGTSLSNNGQTSYYQLGANNYFDGSDYKYIASNYAGFHRFSNAGAYEWHIAASGTAGNTISFTQAMTLDASGNLGIGTTSPSVRVTTSTARAATVTSADFGETGTGSIGDVNKITLKVQNTLGGSTGGSGIGAILEASASNKTGLGFYYDGGSGSQTEAARIDSSGNLGIGTSSPAARLHVSDAVAGGQVLVTTNETNSTSKIGSLATMHYTNAEEPVLAISVEGGSSDNIVQIGGGPGEFNAATIIKFVTAANNTTAGGSERARIDSSGNLLVGATGAGGSKFRVNSSGLAGAFYVTAASTTATEGIQVVKYDNNSTTAQVFQKFYINDGASACGQINANGANTAAFGSTSDSRLKENIVDLPSQLDNIMSLRPVEFDYIESEGGGHQIGFIAQEVQAIYPDLVGERADGMFTLTDLNKNDARLIKAIQELKALVDTQASTITQLQADVEALKNPT